MGKRQRIKIALDWLKVKDLEYIRLSWIWELLFTLILSAIWSYFFISTMNDYIEKEVKDIGFLVTGVIAGMVSLLISFNNKENELNKYRMKWCEDVRSLTHAYLSEIASVKMSISTFSHAYKSDYSRLMFYYDKFINDDGINSVKSISQKALNIELFLKKKNKVYAERKISIMFASLHKEFLHMLAKIHYYGEMAKTGKEIEDLDEKLKSIDDSLKGLKRNYISPLKSGVGDYLNNEWNKIKFGSLLFRVKRCMMISFIIAMFVSAVYKIGV